MVTIVASAVDEGPVAGVQFQVNGVNLGSEVTSPPYQIDLDTHTLPNGPADLTAAARDTAGNDTVSAPVPVTVFNQPRLPMNIVFILTDDQRANTMAQMPLTMSLIGNPGVRFVNAFATTPLCCPARATILTGLYTHNHNVRSNGAPYGAPAFADASTIATWLQAAGYRTALVGKYLNLYNKKTPWPYQAPGWSYWSVFKAPNYYSYRLVENYKEVLYGSTTSAYSTKVIARKAVAFIDSTPPSQPLFLHFAPFAPHEPATPASIDQTLFSTLAKWRPPAFNEADVSDKPLWIRNLPLLTSTVKQTQDNFRLKQLRSLQAVDRAVRDIVNALIRTGRMSNTAIVFASDNGLSWGEHRYRFKNCVYEECIRIPFMVLAPGIPPRVDSSFVALIDLAPTFAEWTGVTPPFAVNGVSLVGLLANPGRLWRQELLLEVLGTADPNGIEGLFSGVRTQRYTYAEHTTGELELYDMKVDPNQLTNIAGDPANAGLIAQLSSLVASLKSQ
jgi:arylsulfatase A-like enzyme